ncbi:hypothetical protein D1822_16535 [Phaeobacter inhibens]|uniref:Uncharacterized protein n=1 Tax=Phaeobacter inhibens TaxID=221822 RepID=A0A135IER0_9RHOB|nr:MULTISPECIES: hypothetical protein [Phaeobacter]AFO89148.1 hypothetical protein PGA2_c31850 [Phaeobacter inhibens 2.10]AFO92998.1 hypothetical protein PGA1_c33590 [Phaeobacter inhibens DSM 17395]APX16210.1 hypothetical protein BWR17_10460 [Phaeobacter inhibens]AUQ47700.1 hypothetical protein PhaeoP10_03407 [Phaeobacter inhibens]AUQ51645.1 hypothetical protein PhaeoP83_03418 [Phaeobacter inhibens]
MFRSTRSSADIKPHRKFITLIVAAAVAVTGFSAAPARADEDVAKVLAGLAVLGIIGAIVKNNRDDDHPQVTRPHRPTHGRPNRPHRPKPLPPRVARYDLPAQCVRYFPRYSQSRTLMGRGCLRKQYGFEHKLPRACQVTFWNGKRNRVGYRPDCLKNRGYRITRR